MREFQRSMFASISLTALAWPMLASANYVESVDGDLSGDHLNPTWVALVSNGSATVSGTVQGAGMATSIDLDYFTVSVPVGQRLASLIVRDGTSGGGATGIFFGMFPGATGVDPSISVSTDLLGYELIGAADIGMDILDDMGVFNFMGTNPSMGFVPPLPAADYTFWIQEGANGTFPYSFEFVLRAVPEPTTAQLMVLAGLAMFLRRRV